MVNNIDNNPNVFSKITGEANNKYVAYSYLNQTGDPSVDNTCNCATNWWCTDFAGNLGTAIGGIGSALVTAKFGKAPANNTKKTTPAENADTNVPVPMSTGEKVLIGGAVVGGIAVIITIFVVMKKKK